MPNHTLCLIKLLSKDYTTPLAQQNSCGLDLVPSKKPHGVDLMITISRNYLGVIFLHLLEVFHIDARTLEKLASVYD